MVQAFGKKRLLGLGSNSGGAVQDLLIGGINDLHNAAGKAADSNRYFMDAPNRLAAAKATFAARGVHLSVLNGDAADGNVTEEQTILDLLAMLGLDVITGGNHDFEHLTRELFSALTRMPNSGFFKLVMRGRPIFFLNPNFQSDNPNDHYANGAFNYQNTFVPEDQRNWLAEELAKIRVKAIIFAHQLLMRQDLANYVKNADAVRAVYENSGKVLAVIHAHAHYNDKQVINGIPHYVLQAACESPNSNAYWIMDVKRDDSFKILGFGGQTTWEVESTEDTFIARMNPPPSPYREAAARALYQFMHANRDMLDFFVVTGPAHSKPVAFMNWMTMNAYDMVEVGNLVFIADDSVASDGALSYGNLWYNPKRSGGKLGRHGFFGFIVLSGGASNNSLIGNRDMKGGRSNGGFGTRFWTAVTHVSTVANSYPALNWALREEDARYKKYEADVLLDTVEEAVTDVYDANITVGQVAGSYPTNKIGLIFGGGRGTGGRMWTPELSATLKTLYINYQRAPLGEPSTLQSILDRAATDSTREAIITVLYDIMAAHRSGIKLLHTQAAHSSPFSLINWPTRGLFDCVPVNNPVYVTDRGWTGDAALSYLTTNFNPLLEGVGMQHGFSILIGSAGASNASAAGNANLRRGRTNTQSGGRAGNTVSEAITGLPSTMPRMLGLHRGDANSYVLTENGAVIGTLATPYTGHSGTSIDYCRATTTYWGGQIRAGLLTTLPYAEHMLVEAGVMALAQSIGAY